MASRAHVYIPQYLRLFGFRNACWCIHTIITVCIPVPVLIIIVITGIYVQVNNVVQYVETKTGERYVLRIYNNGNQSEKVIFEHEVSWDHP